MVFNRTKLKQVKHSDLKIGEQVYELNQFIISYIVDVTYNASIHTVSIPLIVVSDSSMALTKNKLVHRPISKLSIA